MLDRQTELLRLALVPLMTFGLCSIAHAAGGTPAYNFQIIAPIAGDSDSFANGINNSSTPEVVGQSDSQAAFSSGPGTFHAFGTSSGGDGAANAVNDGGIAVGNYANATSGEAAFVSDTTVSNPTLTPLPTFGGTDGIASAVNGNVAAYEIVGQSEYSNGTLHAFSFMKGASALTPLDPSSTSTGIGGTGLGASSAASGLNASGLIVGQATSASADAVHAFLYDPSTANPAHARMYDLGTENGPTGTSYATAINTGGVIVGTSDTSDGNSRAFLYSGYSLSTAYGTGADQPLNGTFTDLGALDGTSSVAYAINAGGSVVGSSSVGGGATDDAFIYRSGVGMQDLNGLISPGSGYQLEAATGINNAGDITGFATNGTDTYAFLLTPTAVPEPACGSLLLAIGYLARRRSRRMRV